MSRSPFVVVKDFLSPLTCEKILKDINVPIPDIDINGDPKKSEHFNLFWEQEIVERFREVIPTIEEQMDVTYRGLEKPIFQFYPENAKAPAEAPGCENSKYLRKKWVMHKDVDLVGFIWLKDYNDRVPLDDKFEVYGGRLEFPVHNFSLLPQRGSLVIFPAGPHFISLISHILVGDLYQIKLNVGVTEKDGGRWFYDPKKFPGTWETWLKEHY